MNTQSKIVEILRQIAGKPIDPSPDESLFESGLLESFSLANLVAELERESSVKIPDSDRKPHKLETVQRIEAYLQSRN
jgi:acyl carrier protein